ncbi:hypothetical protein [Flavobacterium sp.]|uniref:hypothetical protein n=1 Tax=Flavobacterium sp. TaxID=239 RepID=UPI0026345C78|nr:hypothetical protein [Flavobacterium sp.]
MKILEYKSELQAIAGLLIVMIGGWLILEFIHPIYIEFVEPKEEARMSVFTLGSVFMILGALMSLPPSDES